VTIGLATAFSEPACDLGCVTGEVAGLTETGAAAPPLAAAAHNAKISNAQMFVMRGLLSEFRIEEYENQTRARAFGPWLK
jgi:hypothetical protein